MNANIDTCIKEKRKKALPDLEVVMILALIDLLCLIFFASLLSLFLLIIDVIIVMYALKL